MRSPSFEDSRNTVMNDVEIFDKLLHQYLEGVATPDEIALLEAMLLADDALVERASEQSLLHRQVFELLAEQHLHELMDKFAVGSKTVPNAMRHVINANTERGRQAASPSPATRSKNHRWQIAGLVAALAASLLAILLWQEAPVDDTQQLAAPTEPATFDDAAATVTQLSATTWKPGAREYHYGDALPNGSRICLESGMAKLTFECGAEVMLEGPCDFIVRDEMVGILTKGKIAANVPRRAFAFAILSPGVDFVDLGTSFGISVDENGKSELHVFEGEVLYSPTDANERDRHQSVHVTANNAVGFQANGAPSQIAMNSEQFSPLLSLRKATPKYDAPLSGANLALWLTADAGVSTDPEQRVLSWQDIVSDDNRTAEDATQPNSEARPELIPNAIGGHAAIRFDGNSDFLTTTPLETTDDQTVLLVCQYSQGAFVRGRQWGGQILNYDGPPSREASNTFAPGILQIGEPLLETDFKPTLITGQVFAGFIGSAVVESGRVDGRAIGANKPVIIAYNYDYTHGKAQLAINGQVMGESRAFAPQALASRKIIGRHAWKELFFCGDLAELLIYNKALEADELDEATSFLAEKYGIALIND
jgi:hypothetical protein